MLPFISIFGRQVAMYGLLNVIGAALGMLAAVYLAGHRTLARQDVFFASLYAVIGMLVGGKLLFVITVLPVLWARSAELYLGSELLNAVIYGGFVFYGGLIGAAVAVRLYCRSYKLSALRMFDALVPGLALAHAVGRVGCFFAGCCHGIEYTGPAAVIIGGVSRFPVQLLESALLLIISGALLLFLRKERAAGKIAGLYLASYSIVRFCLEFVRGDIIRGAFLLLSTSQWLSLALLPAGLYLMFRHKKGALL
ncbi:MAG: prolipoprotein diacylglyceryl transferase [Clostridiales bacterium]|nr:prolipoprotein diacylglyceryl transferase [Clostridiales bacterium]